MVSLTPRIVIISELPGMAGYVRSALALLDTAFTLTEIPDPVQALQELEQNPIQLFVTSYKLDGMNGIDLVKSANQQSPTTHFLVIGDQDDPAFDAQELAEAPYDYLVRPIAPQMLMIKLQKLLGMEVEESVKAAALSGAVDPGPSPVIPIEELRPVVSELLNAVGAMAVVLSNRRGEVLLEQGAIGYLDREEMTTALGPSMIITPEIMNFVGGSEPWALHFYDGEQFDIFALTIGIHFIIMLIFEGTAGNRAFGSVNVYGRRSVDEMLDIIGDAAFEIMEAPEPAPRIQQPAQAPVAPHQQEAAEKTAPEPAAPPADERTLPPQPVAEPIEAAPEELASLFETNMEAAEETNTLDLWDLASGGQEALTESGDGLSFEEALGMGILDPNEFDEN